MHMLATPHVPRNRSWARPATAGAAKSPHPMSSGVNDICIERGLPKEVPCHIKAAPCLVGQRKQG